MTKIHYMTKIRKTWQFCRLQKSTTWQKYAKQWQKIDNAVRKMNILCNLQNCHFFCVFLAILVQPCQKYRQRPKSIRKLTRNDNASGKCNFCNLQNNKTWRTKWQTKTLMTKNDETWQTKLQLQKMTKNDRQNWNDKKSQQKSKMTN